MTVGPGQGFINRSRETGVRLVQLDFEVHLDCVGRLVDDVRLAFPRSPCRAYGFNRPSPDLAARHA